MFYGLVFMERRLCRRVWPLFSSIFRLHQVLRQGSGGRCPAPRHRALGVAEKLDWQLTDEGLEIRFPEHKPCSCAYTFKILFDREVGKDLQSEASDEILKQGSPV